MIENLPLNRGSEGGSQASETVSVTLVMVSPGPAGHH